MDDRTRDQAYKMANDIYSLYFVGCLIGYATAVIGFALSFRFWHTGDAVLDTHFRFQRVLAGQMMLVMAALSGIAYALHRAQLAKGWLIAFLLLTLLPSLYWWIRRNMMGYALLAREMRIQNSGTWGWPQGEPHELD